MKRITTLFIGLFACISLTFAQTFAFFHNGTQLENNAEITVSEITSEGGLRAIESHLGLKNLTDATITATVSQTILEEPTEGGQLSFCFTLCRISNEDLTQEDDIQPMSFYENFHMSFYQPTLGTATAKVQYDVYPSDNESDKYSVIVNYDPSRVGLSAQKADKGNLSIYQSGNNIIMDYNIKALGNLKLYVYNATGMVVAQHTLTSSQGSLSLQESLQHGIYIAAIKQGNTAISLQKFVIK